MNSKFGGSDPFHKTLGEGTERVMRTQVPVSNTNTKSIYIKWLVLNLKNINGTNLIGSEDTKTMKLIKHKINFGIMMTNVKLRNTLYSDRQTTETFYQHWASTRQSSGKTRPNSANELIPFKLNKYLTILVIPMVLKNLLT